MIIRALQVNQVVRDNSLFLFGPRGVGKSRLVHTFFSDYPNTLLFNFLSLDELRRYQSSPSVFVSEVKTALRRSLSGAPLVVAVDEVQLFPPILNEVHKLIEEHNNDLRFILTGSSARKLKRSGANLLAGRAVTKHLHPISILENDLILTESLQFGMLPAVLSHKTPKDYLRSYVETYLKEEIIQEAVVRRFDSFVGFLELAAQYSGKIINFSKLGRELKVSSSAIQDYFSILTDTLLATRVNGWSRSTKKQLTMAPKFYLFDCGVLNAITRMVDIPPAPRTIHFGYLFENFIVNQLRAARDYFSKDFEFNHYRTSQGEEIDIIINRGPFRSPIAIEIKSSDNPDLIDLRALLNFKEEFPDAPLYCFCLTDKEFEKEGIEFIPWREGILRVQDW